MDDLIKLKKAAGRPVDKMDILELKSLRKLKRKGKFIGQVWPHKRVRKYLGIDEDEPIIGTIVKPKWLPAKLFAESVTRAAIGGALFVKSDENLHLNKKELVIEHGFSHHLAMAMTDISKELKTLCEYYGIEYLNPEER